MPSRIFVSGATGFIGAPLVGRLLDAGHRVTAWVRAPERAAKVVDGRAKLFALTEDEGALDEALRGHDAVVSLAGAPVIKRWTPAYREVIVRSRVDLTRRLVRAIDRVGDCRVLLSASGVGYYGDRGDEELRESSSAGDDFLARLCVDWEAAALAANTRVVCARTGFVLGPRGGALAAMRLPFLLGVGGKLGDGRLFMPWIHRDDLLSMFEHALFSDAVVGPMNAVGPSPVRNADFTRALGRAMRRPTFMFVPRVALRVLYGQASETILASTRAFPAVAQATGFEFRHTNLDAALADVFAQW